MDENTATLLIETIGEALRLAADCELKVVALERVLEKQDSPFLLAYRAEIWSLRKERAYTLNLEALSKLKQSLVRG